MLHVQSGSICCGNDVIVVAIVSMAYCYVVLVLREKNDCKGYMNHTCQV